MQSGAKMAATQGRPPHLVSGGQPGGSTNQVEPRGSCPHRPLGLILSARLSRFEPSAILLPRGL